jgi:hypothetical protein
MKTIENIATFLLSLWLVTWGVLRLFSVPVRNIDTYFWVLAVVAGVLLLFRLNDPKAFLNVGMLLLVIWLLMSGLLRLLAIDFPGSQLALSVTAILAGIFMLPSVTGRTFYNTGLFFLGVWLIASQVLPMFVGGAPLDVGLALLAGMAAILLLLGL